MDAVFSQVVTAVPQPSVEARFELDLSNVAFIDPYGMVCLHSIARFLESRFKQVLFHLPEDENARGYLNRIGFKEAIGSYAILKSDDDPVHFRRREESEVLLELTPIRGKTDIDRVIKKILDRVSKILGHELEYTTKDINDFMTILSEVCWNINDHSENEGIAAVQRYTKKQDGSKYVIIGVSDLGIGIRASLGRRYDVTSWDDATAIINALKKDFSQHPERGLGLYRVRQLIHEFRGSLHIRSGSSRLYLRHTAKLVRSTPFPGTHIYISLSERRNNP